MRPTALPVGDALTVNTSIPVSDTLGDIGLAISSTATPPATGSANGYDTWYKFDSASWSLRPSQSVILLNTSISGTFTPYAGGLAAPANTVGELYIENIGGGLFTFGYIDTSDVLHESDTVQFSGTSTIGDAIGVFGDLNDFGGRASLGSLSDLTIEPISAFVPEPSAFALAGAGLGLIGLLPLMRRRGKV